MIDTEKNNNKKFVWQMCGLCLVEELTQEEYVTNELLWFECTPVKTGQVWQFGYFFYEYHTCDLLGIDVYHYHEIL